MADNNIKFPPRNLPGSAETWGRKVEDETRELRRNVQVLDQSLNNNARSTAGQLSSISSQLNFLTTQLNVATPGMPGETNVLVNYTPAKNDGWTYYTFDGTKDTEIYITAPESGKIKIDFSVNLETRAYADSVGGTVVATTAVLIFVQDTVTNKDLITSNDPEIILGGASFNKSYFSASSTLSSFALFTDLIPGREYVVYSIRANYSEKASDTSASSFQTYVFGGVEISVTNLRA